MKKFVIVCLALAASIGGIAGKSQAATWSYVGNGFTGSFHASRENPNQWVERVSTGAVYTFRTTNFGPGFIDLFDDSRGVTVRLCANACYILHSGTGGQFSFLYNRTAPLLPPMRCGPGRVEITGE